jgi:hypothetical protein
MQPASLDGCKWDDMVMFLCCFGYVVCPSCRIYDAFCILPYLQEAGSKSSMAVHTDFRRREASSSKRRAVDDFDQTREDSRCNRRPYELGGGL